MSEEAAATGEGWSGLPTVTPPELSVALTAPIGAWWPPLSRPAVAVSWGGGRPRMTGAVVVRSHVAVAQYRLEAAEYLNLPPALVVYLFDSGKLRWPITTEACDEYLNENHRICPGSIPRSMRGSR